MEALEEHNIDVQWVDGQWILVEAPHAVRWDCCPIAAQLFETSDILHRIVTQLSAPISLLLAPVSRTLYKALSPSHEGLWKRYYQEEFNHPATVPLMPHGSYSWFERYKQARLLLLSPFTARWQTFPVAVNHAPEPGGSLWPLGRRGARGVVACASASLVSTGDSMSAAADCFIPVNTVCISHCCITPRIPCNGVQCAAMASTKYNAAMAIK